MDNIVDWDSISKQYPIGYLLTASVEYKAPFGVFLDIGHPIVKGLVEIIEFSDEEPSKQTIYPQIGQRVTGIIMDYTVHNNQIRLSMKPSKLQFSEGPIVLKR